MLGAVLCRLGRHEIRVTALKTRYMMGGKAVLTRFTPGASYCKRCGIPLSKKSLTERSKTK